MVAVENFCDNARLGLGGARGVERLTLLVPRSEGREKAQPAGRRHLINNHRHK
jgi:hypothetical protein